MSTATKRKETDTTESIPFAAETSKVLRLMIHSLYTNKDIFLRELISNASDACDKLRYRALSEKGLLEEGHEFAIRVAFDEDQRTLTVADNGIGMGREELISQLGTIARSGTEEFFAQLSGDHAKDSALIGQFGVGFYSSFMVADRVEVTSRKAGEEEAWRWESDGDGYFRVTPAEGPSTAGTSVTLHLKEEAKAYLDFFRLRHIIETYSDHISFPILLKDREGNEERVNSASALWTRPKSEITDEQYQEFYRHVAHQPDEPWLTLHNTLEGRIEYSYLLYIPSMKPFDLFHPERRCRVKLYVKRVFITDEGVELIPAWLRFMRGVVDSADLPLNISRETLQDNPVLAKIREGITKKVLSELKQKSKNDSEAYEIFWENFGAVVKEGLCESLAPKEAILEACLFHSSAEEQPTTLADYIARMQEDQEAIYVLAGDNLETLRKSPQLEGFKARGIEVLLLTDHVDDFWISATPKYKEYDFRSVTKAGDDLEKFTKNSEEAVDEETKTDAGDMATLIAYIKTTLGDQVRDVRTTAKLSQSPVCLAIGEGDMEMRMERFLLEHKQLPKGMAKILEINPAHPIICALSAQVAGNKTGSESEDAVWLLFDQARIQEGEPIADPLAFARRISGLLGQSLSQNSG